MKLVGLMPCRNEAHILGLSARVALKWCDELVILDHGSKDSTSRITQELYWEARGRVDVIYFADPIWREMTHREILLTRARESNASHIAIIDADEILTGNLLPNIRSIVEACEPGNILMLPGYNMRGAIDRYHSNGIWSRRWFSTAFADDPRLHWACEGYDHHHREPRGMLLNAFRPVRQGTGGVMHLWAVTDRHVRAKHAWYKVTEMLKGFKTAQQIDEMYSWAIHGRLPHDPAHLWTYQQAPADWWEPYVDLIKYLHDVEPWQEAEVRRLVAEHGAERFKGLDLFGVV